MKKNEGMLKYYEFFLNPECERWLRNVFVYNAMDKEKELATIDKTMGMDYKCIEILTTICDEYLKNNEEVNDNTYIIYYGACFLKIEKIIDEDIKYKVSTCPKNGLKNKIISIHTLKIIATYYSSIMHNVDILIKEGIRIEDIIEYLNECFNTEKSVKSK